MFLMHWSVRMIRAKNYKTVFKFVKVMPRILVASFFLDTVYRVAWYAGQSCLYLSICAGRWLFVCVWWITTTHRATRTGCQCQLVVCGLLVVIISQWLMLNKEICSFRADLTRGWSLNFVAEIVTTDGSRSEIMWLRLLRWQNWNCS